MSFNRVVILGNIGQDPELRRTQNGSAVVTLSVATNEKIKGKDGEADRDLTEWHRVVVWNKSAENCAKYLAKGRTVLVEGRLQTRSWEDKTGNKQYTTEIVAHNVQFISGQAGKREDPPLPGEPPAGSRDRSDPDKMPADYQDELPF